MVQITEKAIGKVKEIMSSQDPAPSGLRISVVGGGCSGFSYSMAFENTPNILDKTYTYDGLKVFVDQASLLYLDGAEVDFVETLEGSGFKFNNPQVKSTCGCGSSFQVEVTYSASTVGRAILPWGPLWGRLSGGFHAWRAFCRLRSPAESR